MHNNSDWQHQVALDNIRAHAIPTVTYSDADKKVFSEQDAKTRERLARSEQIEVWLNQNHPGWRRLKKVARRQLVVAAYDSCPA